MQASLGYDKRSEDYRISGVEYKLIYTKVLGMLRREQTPDNDPKAWEEITELIEEKKPEKPPPPQLITKWKKNGMLEVGLLPPGVLPVNLIKHKKALVKDGISGEADFKHVNPQEIIRQNSHRDAESNVRQSNKEIECICQKWATFPQLTN